MGRFIARRLVQAVPTLFGIFLLTFLLSRLSPADPVKLMVAGNFDITPEDRAVLYHNLGLDDPLPIQFVHFLGDVARLNFGNSFYYHRPVVDLIGERIPNSLQLSLLSLLLALAIGVPLGVIAAYNRGKLADHVIRITSVAGLVNKDYPMVQASVIIGALLLLVSYILRDIAYAWVDPRIKVR